MGGAFTVGIEVVIAIAAIVLIFLSIGLWFVERREAAAEDYVAPPRC